MRGEYCDVFHFSSGIEELPPHARRIRGIKLGNSAPGGTTSACAENTTTPRTILPYSRNYLRMRGEYNLTTHPPTCYTELPPHARRIRGLMGLRFFCTGTTSACAENTFPCSRTWVLPGNYLRMRGEYLLTGVAFSAKGELPPHARRIRIMAVTALKACGTTSACAENTLHVTRGANTFGNYLRMRGEYRLGHGR